MAVAGVVALLATALLVAASICGRAINRFGLGPIPGDYELVEIAAAFTIFSFLPWCQASRGHVVVDLLAARFSAFGARLAERTAAFGMACAAALVALRLSAGFWDKTQSGETTVILQIPIWAGYLASLPGAWLFAAAAAVVLVESFLDPARAAATRFTD